MADQPSPEVTVTKTLRVHESTERYVRVIGDGTPENTRLLDPQGEPIPESVLWIQITLEAGNCARGTFVYYNETAPPGVAMRDSFEAWVILEPPLTVPKATVSVEDYNNLIGDFNRLAERYNLLAEAASAAAFALKAGGVEAGVYAGATDASVPGPSTDDLIQITEKPGDETLPRGVPGEYIPPPVDVTTRLDDDGELVVVSVEPASAGNGVPDDA